MSNRLSNEMIPISFDLKLIAVCNELYFDIERESLSFLMQSNLMCKMRASYPPSATAIIQSAICIDKALCDVFDIYNCFLIANHCFHKPIDIREAHRQIGTKVNDNKGKLQSCAA